MTTAEALPEPETMAELVAAWQLWQRARGLSERTITERAMVITRLPNAAAVTALEIDRFLLHRGWSKATRATYHQAIRAWCRWLILTSRRPDDPTLMAPPPKVPKNQPRPLADVHLTKLLRSVNRLRTRAMILLAAYAGLRVSEVAAVRGEDLDLLDRTITVIGKGDKRRTIPLHPVLIDLARSMPETGWWFPTYTGNHQSANGHMLGNSVSGTVSAAMQAAGVPGTPHALRHWFATTLRTAGIDTLIIKELMGHDSLTTTAIYIRIPAAQQAEAVRTLPAIGFGTGA